VGLLLASGLVLLVLVCRWILIPYRIHGDSMAPTLLGAGSSGDWVLVWRPAYTLRDPARWDVVVVRRGTSRSDRESVKRIVGLPGERIEVQGGRVHVDGEPLIPPTTIEDVYVASKGQWGYGAFRLGADEYFLLGDNSYPSADSRQWGPVTRESIQGRVVCIVHPAQRTSLVR
jgi:signal peptidase I